MGRLFAGLAAAFCLTPFGACASNDPQPAMMQTQSAAQAPAAVQPSQSRQSARLNLRNTSIYVYSFLDIRERGFGPRTLDAFDTQIVDALRAYGVTAKVLRFKNSEPGQSFAFSDYSSYGFTSASTPVPVRETIEANYRDEQAFHPNYRLIVFPSNFFTADRSFNTWSIKWTLIDVRDGQIVMSASSEGRRIAWTRWDTGGGPARTRAIVNGLIEELKARSMVQADPALNSDTLQR